MASILNYILAVPLVQYYKHFLHHPKVKGSGLAACGIERENGKKLTYALTSCRNTAM
jgi:hypothetical protein